LGKKALSILVLAIAVMSATLVTSCTPKTVSPTDLSDAAQIFSNDCASCHKSDRTGGHGPNIQNKSLTEYSETSLAVFLSDHKTAKNLTPAQRSIMAEWLKTN
jgi:mono/diheme cytochrome c family protein